MTSNEEFSKSYTHTVGEFVGAVVRCHESGDEFEDILDRKYEEGFADGLAHAYALLTGTAYGDAVDTSIIERDIRDERPPFICQGCQQWRTFLQGSGDCKLCESCCTCTPGNYCTPY